MLYPNHRSPDDTPGIAHTACQTRDDVSLSHAWTTHPKDVPNTHLGLVTPHHSPRIAFEVVLR
jgi:hypothetical protein